ncbi:hypothetical protein [Mucilaginibacter paludis]|uniref:hypothetical protein n=1 Tax=Mucilaginibacter paludis TaxID=423351 RepID=UPI00145E5840|nr:hypothetical protein [Mucilaginibacter paludis]
MSAYLTQGQQVTHAGAIPDGHGYMFNSSPAGFALTFVAVFFLPGDCSLPQADPHGDKIHDFRFP